VYVLPLGTMLGVWTGPDDAAIRARMAAGRFFPPGGAPLAGGGAGAAEATAPAGGPALPVPLQVAGALLLVGVYVVYFFKGASWAGGAPAAAVSPVTAAELRARLTAINDLDVPFAVESASGDGALAVTWRYADAKWIDHARAHGMKRAHRVLLRLDEGDRTVRATDFVAGYDWSAGMDGARIEWRASAGITFFQHEHRRVFGLQVGPDGRLTPALSYAYTFNLQEMKSPLIAAVTQAGWAWKPVLWWNAPRWLRWLTE
jgi:hypothetical protein